MPAGTAVGAKRVREPRPTVREHSIKQLASGGNNAGTQWELKVSIRAPASEACQLKGQFLDLTRCFSKNLRTLTRIDVQTTSTEFLDSSDEKSDEDSQKVKITVTGACERVLELLQNALLQAIPGQETNLNREQTGGAADNSSPPETPSHVAKKKRASLAVKSPVEHPRTPATRKSKPTTRAAAAAPAASVPAVIDPPATRRRSERFQSIAAARSTRAAEHNDAPAPPVAPVPPEPPVAPAVTSTTDPGGVPPEAMDRPPFKPGEGTKPKAPAKYASEHGYLQLLVSDGQRVAKTIGGTGKIGDVTVLMDMMKQCTVSNLNLRTYTKTGVQYYRVTCTKKEWAEGMELFTLVYKGLSHWELQFFSSVAAMKNIELANSLLELSKDPGTDSKGVGAKQRAQVRSGRRRKSKRQTHAVGGTGSGSEQVVVEDDQENRVVPTVAAAVEDPASVELEPEQPTPWAPTQGRTGRRRVVSLIALTEALAQGIAPAERRGAAAQRASAVAGEVEKPQEGSGGENEVPRGSAGGGVVVADAAGGGHDNPDKANNADVPPPEDIPVTGGDGDCAQGGAEAEGAPDGNIAVMDGNDAEVAGAVGGGDLVVTEGPGGEQTGAAAVYVTAGPGSVVPPGLLDTAEEPVVHALGDGALHEATNVLVPEAGALMGGVADGLAMEWEEAPLSNLLPPPDEEPDEPAAGGSDGGMDQNGCLETAECAGEELWRGMEM